jgi:hypothetical protein
MAADLAVYDLDQPRFFGLHDPAVGPVASGGRATLRALLVQGRVVVETTPSPAWTWRSCAATRRPWSTTMLKRPRATFPVPHVRQDPTASRTARSPRRCPRWSGSPTAASTA